MKPRHAASGTGSAGLPAVDLRPMTRGDFPSMVQWLAEPHIARWWGAPHDARTVEAKYGPRIDRAEPTEMLVVLVGDVAGGVVQTYRHSDYPEHDSAVRVPRAAGIDYFLSLDFTGRGIGRVMLRATAANVFALYPSVDWCVATPSRTNSASCLALERAGFENMGACQVPDEPPGLVYAARRGRIPTIGDSPTDSVGERDENGCGRSGGEVSDVGTDLRPAPVPFPATPRRSSAPMRPGG